MNHMTIWDEFNCVADIVLTGTVSKVRKKDLSLKFCTVCRSAWQWTYQFTTRKGEYVAIKTVEYFWFGGGCIDKPDWIDCPKCILLKHGKR